MLARGDDDTLKNLAGQELGEPTEGLKQFKLAEGWYESAKKDAPPKGNPVLLDRAKHWYEKSVSTLTGGVELHIAQKRIDELSRQEDTRPAGTAATSKAVADTSGPRRGVIYASCRYSFDMYVNGKRLVMGSSSDVTQIPYEFNSGDVITVRASGSSAISHRGFACVILIEPPGKAVGKRKRQPLVFQTGVANWEGYMPNDTMEWYKPENIAQKGPWTRAEIQTSSRTISSQPLRSVAVTQASGAQCMSIWANTLNTTAYLTLTINFPNK
jgi:hypothetical protein